LTVDVIIVGGGSAGLQAALLLGRCRREVLLISSGAGRNHGSTDLYGFLSRDGIPPLQLIEIARDQLARYPNVKLLDAHVTEARALEQGFEVKIKGSSDAYSCRKLLLTTGLLDVLPSAEGFKELYGHSVFTCPYCDGWEHNDRPIAIHCGKSNGPDFALEMLLWSRDIALLLDGARISDEDSARMQTHCIQIYPQRIKKLTSEQGRLKDIVFEDGETLGRCAIFLANKQNERCELAEQLHAACDGDGHPGSGKHGKTNVRGFYAAGDANGDVEMAIVGAGEGALAAFAINQELVQEDLKIWASR
jgi:thioredoxin reductase